MRRTLLALPLVVGVLVFPSAASATHDLLGFQSAVDAMHAVDRTLDPPPNDGKHDFVVGGFQAGRSNFGVSAHSDPLGNDVWGHVSQTTPDGLKLRGRVTCLAVAGTIAAYGFVVTHSNSPFAPPGSDFVHFVRDSGLPGGMGDTWGSSTSAAALCPIFAVANIGSPIARGNILVHDAQP